MTFDLTYETWYGRPTIVVVELPDDHQPGDTYPISGELLKGIVQQLNELNRYKFKMEQRWWRRIFK